MILGISMAKALYVVLLGGKHPKANIEVHDLIPLVTEHLSDSYAWLKQQWFGLQKGVHIDGWMKVNRVMYGEQCYQVTLSETPQHAQPLKLYLINLGAYLPEQFGEVHKYVVVIATDAKHAKQQGKLAFEKQWFKPHTDAVIDIDDYLLLEQIQHYYVHLLPIENMTSDITFQNDYIVL